MPDRLFGFGGTRPSDPDMFSLIRDLTVFLAELKTASEADRA